MKPRIIPLMVVAALVTAFVGSWKSGALRREQQVPSNKQKTWDDPTTLHARVKKEKDKGLRKITFPAPLIEYPEIDLTTAQAETSVVIADVIDKRSLLIDQNTIGTFYKLRIVETLAKASSPVCCNPKDEEFPTDLPTLAEDETYMVGIGGTVMLDDVEVTVEEDFKELSPGRRYLLFVTPTLSGKFSLVKLGPKGMFLIKSDGQLESAVSKSYKLRRDIELLFNNSLIKLKENIKQAVR